MSLWQATMIAMARSGSLRRIAQDNRWLHGMAARFVGGRDAAEALERTLSLKNRRIAASLFYLGEYVDDAEMVERNVSNKLKIIALLGERSELDLHLSVDPSQIGYAISDSLGEANALRIGRALAGQPNRGRKVLMLDMEDFSYVQRTLDLREWLTAEGIPTAITIQAKLRRSEEDIRRLVSQGAMVRLVKGAFVEKRERAYTRKSEIDANYLHLARLLLSSEAKAKGVYPVFATHDDAMVEAITPLVLEGGRNPGEYEFEMLFGVRSELHRQLVSSGHHLRLYLPFGTEWWAYTVRRIGENPANVGYVLSALWKGKGSSAGLRI